MRLLKKWWFRVLAIGLAALMVAGSTLFWLSFRVSIETVDGVVSIGLQSGQRALASYTPGAEVVGKRTRYSKTVQGDQPNEFTATLVSSPEFTQDTQGQYVSYMFEDFGDHYKIQHPWASVEFFDYYTKVWDEDFSAVKIYDDRWIVEYWQRQGGGRWRDTSFYNVVRSYELASDEIRLIRTGDTVIGQRQEIYYFRQGSPVKIEIRQTTTDAQTMRFVWKPSGIVADSEMPFSHSDNDSKIAGLRYYQGIEYVYNLSWYQPIESGLTVNYIVDNHAQGRKASITFSEFVTAAGGTAVLDPDTFYPDADPESSSWDGTLMRHGVNEVFATIKAGVGTYHYDSSTDANIVGVWSTSTSNQYQRYYRTIFGFPTAALPDTANISAATIGIRGNGKTSGLGNKLSVQIYGATVNSVTGATASPDFENLVGYTTAFSTAVPYASWGATWQTFALNASGIANISTTNASWFSTRDANMDVGAQTPTWASSAYNEIYTWFSEKGNGYKPYLEVTYTVPNPEITVSPTGYNFGTVAVSSTTNTTTNYFTIDNTSTMQTDQTISVTTASWSGGNGWSHNDSGSPGDNATAILANRGGTWGVGDVIVKNVAPNYIYENAPANTDYSFGLGLWTPLTFYDGAEKTITVRVSAVAG